MVISVMREVSAFQASTLRMPIETKMKSSPIGAMASMVRILLLTIVFGAVAGVFIWQGLIGREHELLQEIDRLEEKMAAEVAHRDEMIERLGRTSRLARVEILEQTRISPEDPVETTRMRFVELDQNGAELGRRDYEIAGDVLFIDAWTVRFEHEQVANGDPFAGRSLVLFRRIYSDQIRPADGYAIDTPGGIPEGYAVSEEARYERALWSRFWRLATDPEEARRMGVRVAQGEAVYKPVRTGQRYDLVAESAGGLTMVPIDDEEADEQFAVVPTDD
jgi:hypothetical protein